MSSVYALFFYKRPDDGGDHIGKRVLQHVKFEIVRWYGKLAGRSIVGSEQNGVHNESIVTHLDKGQRNS